jgi:hypothetical protein
MYFFGRYYITIMKKLVKFGSYDPKPVPGIGRKEGVG